MSREGRIKSIFRILYTTVLLLAMVLAASNVWAVDGAGLYNKYCASCHGEKGKGDGPVAKSVFPKPRDFTLGVYKIRSTPTGSLPSDDDLMNVVKNGMSGTSMIPWASMLSDEEIKAIISVVKGFSKFFADEKPEASIKVPNMPKFTSETIANGKKLYMKKGCNECHGDGGKGDGIKSDKLVDDSGNPISAYDFTSGENMKGGSSEHDMYLRLVTGLTGTPMPSYQEGLTDDERWAIISYVKSLVKPAAK